MALYETGTISLILIIVYMVHISLLYARKQYLEYQYIDQIFESTLQFDVI